MKTFCVKPIYGWGWSHNGISINPPEHFSVKLHNVNCESENLLIGTVNVDGYFLDGFDIELKERNTQSTPKIFHLIGKKEFLSKKGRDVVIGYAHVDA